MTDVLAVREEAAPARWWRATTGRRAMTGTGRPGARGGAHRGLTRRDAAIEACSGIAYAALRELRIAKGNAPPPAWVDLPQEERDRQVLHAELLLSGGAVVQVERFFAAVLRSAAVELELRTIDPQGERVRKALAESIAKAPIERDHEMQVEFVEDIARTAAEAFGTIVTAQVGHDRERPQGAAGARERYRGEIDARSLVAVWFRNVDEHNYGSTSRVALVPERNYLARRNGQRAEPLRAGLHHGAAGPLRGARRCAPHDQPRHP